jgi:putative membrane protein
VLIRRSLAVTLVAMAVCLGVAAGSFAGQRPQASPDQTFIKKAVIGGLAEVQLGKLAVEHAASPDVKQFGRRMVEDHDKTNRELMAVVEPKGLAVPTALDRQPRQAADRLTRLQGPAFDRAYSQAMVKDHEEDVKLFRTEAQRGTDPELKRWAATTLSTLDEHLNLARKLATPRR